MSNWAQNVRFCHKMYLLPKKSHFALHCPNLFSKVPFCSQMPRFIKQSYFWFISCPIRVHELSLCCCFSNVGQKAKAGENKHPLGNKKMRKNGLIGCGFLVVPMCSGKKSAYKHIEQQHHQPENRRGVYWPIWTNGTSYLLHDTSSTPCPNVHSFKKCCSNSKVKCKSFCFVFLISKNKKWNTLLKWDIWKQNWIFKCILMGHFLPEWSILRQKQGYGFQNWAFHDKMGQFKFKMGFMANWDTARCNQAF